MDDDLHHHSILTGNKKEALDYKYLIESSLGSHSLLRQNSRARKKCAHQCIAESRRPIIPTVKHRNRYLTRMFIS
jgi:hypothetical protein